MSGAVETSKNAFWTVGGAVSGTAWGAFSAFKGLVGAETEDPLNPTNNADRRHEESKHDDDDYGDEDDDPRKNKEIVNRMVEQRKD